MEISELLSKELDIDKKFICVNISTVIADYNLCFIEYEDENVLGVYITGKDGKERYLIIYKEAIVSIQVVYEGDIPVFIDTEYDTWNMDPVALEKAFEIYPEVKVVVIAHLYGTPGKIDELKRICDKHGAIIVEDAAESLGATYKGKATGTFGKYNAISF